MNLPPPWNCLNPYNFVPLADRPPDRETHRLHGHDRFRGHSGRLACRLELRTPIFIKQPGLPPPSRNPAQRPPLDHIRVDGSPIVPGTSLKGVIRSAVEAVGNGCLVLARAVRPPEAFTACGDQQLCVSCRLFGMVGRGRQARVFGGKVAIGDAHLARDGRGQELPHELDQHVTHLAILSGPKPSHSAFYHPNGRFPGRKFYYHRLDGYLEGPPAGNQNSSVKLFRRGTLDFTVSYQNLSDRELELLLYALELEPAMGHKIGMGKPIGLGSVKIRLRWLADELGGDRYRVGRFEGPPDGADRPVGRTSGLEPPPGALGGGALQAKLAELLQPLSRSPDLPIEALRHIWRLDPRPDLQYPSQAWFADHSQAQLPSPEQT